MPSSKRRPPRRSTTIKVAVALKDRFREACTKAGLNMTEVVQRLIQAHRDGVVRFTLRDPSDTIQMYVDPGSFDYIRARVRGSTNTMTQFLEALMGSFVATDVIDHDQEAGDG